MVAFKLEGDGPVTQSFAEKVEALKSLLPLLEAHLALHPASSITQHYGDAEADPGPPRPPDSCLGDCHNCHAQCREVAWANEWVRLRRAYPVLKKIETLMDQMMAEHADWRVGVYYTLVQPWDAFKREQREEWCRCGLEWLAEQLTDEIPVVEAWKPLTPKKLKNKMRNQEIVDEWRKGAVPEALSVEWGLHLSQVYRIINARKDRPKRTVYAGGG